MRSTKPWSRSFPGLKVQTWGTRKKVEAPATYARAIEISGHMEPERALEYAGFIQESMKKLQGDLWSHSFPGLKIQTWGTRKKVEAPAAYARAIEISGHMEPERALEYAGFIQESMKKL